MDSHRRRIAAANSLSAKLVQLTMPGVPDVYQGSEFWERSLTDPDNRRPVDFGQRRDELARSTPGPCPQPARRPASSWSPRGHCGCVGTGPNSSTATPRCTAAGAAAGHLVAFSRGAASDSALALATRLPAGLAAGGGWRDTAVELSVPMRDELTGAGYGPGSVSGGRPAGHLSGGPAGTSEWSNTMTLAHNGTARFDVWAPDAATVVLVADGREVPHGQGPFRSRH